MRLQILSFGKITEKVFQNIYDAYLKRLGRYCDLKIVELKEEFKYALSKNQVLNTKMLIKYLDTLVDYEVYVLDVCGKAVSSGEFSDILQKTKNFKSGKLCFVVGPSDGYNREMIAAYSKISFGKITFPHQLFRIILLEQIYRSFKIMNNEKYHK